MKTQSKLFRLKHFKLILIIWIHNYKRNKMKQPYRELVESQSKQLAESTGLYSSESESQNSSQSRKKTKRIKNTRETRNPSNRVQKSNNRNQFKKMSQDPQLISKLKSKFYLEFIKITKVKGKQTITVISKKKTRCTITEKHKLFLSIRRGFTSRIQRQQINRILQDIVNDSIKRKQNKMRNKPNEAKQCQEAIDFYKKTKQHIEIFLFDDNKTLNQKINAICLDIFSSADKALLHNPGVRKIQNDKIKNYMQEIGNLQEEEEQLFNVVDFFDKPLSNIFVNTFTKKNYSNQSET